MNRKPSRGILGYFALIGTLLLIAILLNGGLNRTVSKRIEYPDLLKAISEGEVGRVAISSRSISSEYSSGGRFFSRRRVWRVTGSMAVPL